MFTSVSDGLDDELERRKARALNKLKYGISFLDEAMNGITRNDLILIGAPSGQGKTQLCCNIALANISEGKTVHYIALEAEPKEIEARMKYQYVADMFYSDYDRPKIENFSYAKWYMGEFTSQLEKYETDTTKFMAGPFKKYLTFYKANDFGINKFIETVMFAADHTDLIIVDHVHYFDIDDDNENRAMKEIAKMARTLALEIGKPIILVAHLRKRDKYSSELVPGLEEFHGSSDLYKIATRTITMTPGKRLDNGNYETFFRIPKNRIDGGVTRFIAKMEFNPKKGGYENKYLLGRSTQKRDKDFEEYERSFYPEWSASALCGSMPTVSQGQPKLHYTPDGKRYVAGVKKDHHWD